MKDHQEAEEATAAEVHESSRESPTAAADGSEQQGGSFDCNICLELAQDPVVTLCGHLFCWPCLYRWLQMHSICQECPVCKASVEEEKVIPLYGRGKIGSVDPRRKTVPGVNNNIPHRPAGQRPETARPTEQQQYQYYQQHHHGFNFMPAAGPAATARFGNITLSAGFGLFPSLFGFQLHGFPDVNPLGGGHGFHAAANPVSMSSYSRPTTQSMMPDHHQQQQQQEALLSRLLLLLGCFVLLCLLLF